MCKNIGHIFSIRNRVRLILIGIFGSCEELSIQLFESFDFVLILNETCLHHILDEFDVIIASDID
jgi:hypothetical protein